MMKLFTLTILLLSLGAFAAEPAKDYNPDDTNLARSRPGPEETTGGVQARGIDCESCKAAEGANSSSTLTHQDQPPSASSVAADGSTKAPSKKAGEK